MSVIINVEVIDDLFGADGGRSQKQNQSKQKAR